MNSWSMIAMAGALLGAVSCSPVGVPGQGLGSGVGGNSAVLSSQGEGGLGRSNGRNETRVTSGELRELRDQRASAGGERVNNGGSFDGFAGGNGEVPFDEANLPPLPPLRTDYQYALPVPGRKGWVYNPYTNRPVDVRGVGSGRLIYDERDPENRNDDGTLKPVAEMPHKFRVP